MSWQDFKDIAAVVGFIGAAAVTYEFLGPYAVLIPGGIFAFILILASK